MDVEKGHGRSRGMSTLEICLIFIFVAMTGACIGLVVIYFVDKADSETEGECLHLLKHTVLPFNISISLRYFKTRSNIVLRIFSNLLYT